MLKVQKMEGENLELNKKIEQLADRAEQQVLIVVLTLVIPFLNCDFVCRLPGTGQR